MGTFDLDDATVEPNADKTHIVIFRTVLFTLLGLVALSAVAGGGYYYGKYRDSESKVAALSEQVGNLEKDIKAIKAEINGPVDNNQEELSGQITEIDEKLDKLIREVGNVESSVSSIESDVGSIQLRIGY